MALERTAMTEAEKTFSDFTLAIYCEPCFKAPALYFFFRNFSGN